MKGVRSQPFGGGGWEKYAIAEVPVRFGGKWHCASGLLEIKTTTMKPILAVDLSLVMEL